MNTWKIYLGKDLRLNLSSMNPINDIGKQIKGIKKLEKIQNIHPDIANINPPPVAVGFLWELRLLGLSREYLLKNGSDLLIIINEVKKHKKLRIIIIKK